MCCEQAGTYTFARTHTHTPAPLVPGVHTCQHC